MNILTKMSGLDNLTNNEAVLVKYILSNSKEIINKKPSEIANAAFVSVATIYRLVNKLGLSGIGELKIELASTFRTIEKETEIDYDYPILESDTPFQIMQNLSKIYNYTIDETVAFSDPEELVKVGKRLLEAKVIDVYTASANLFFAQILNFKCRKLGF
ncbi:MurR/RpiR family transcriptional regulator [Enterococcus rivorum]|uniref:MurR/RpiR family transcriptional regulator n=1 Tax=Enterococcus rivorum TaxID=762845 RepID=UPI0036322DEC